MIEVIFTLFVIWLVINIIAFFCKTATDEIYDSHKKNKGLDGHKWS